MKGAGSRAVATTDAAARAAALAALPPLESRADDTLRLERGSNVLVIGDARRALAAGVALAAHFDVFVFADGAHEPAPRPRRLRVIGTALAGIDGGFGRFRAWVSTQNGAHDVGGISLKTDGTFDLVLDTGDAPLCTHSVPPLGYFRAADTAALSSVLNRMRALPTFIEKPRYVRYAEALCTHASAGVAGCSRCLAACPTHALASVGDRIKVAYEQCQGCATCTAVCPTGALSYAQPAEETTAARLRTLLDAYRAAGGRTPCMLVHERGDAASAADPRWLPFALPALPMFGLEHVLAAFAWGATQIAFVQSTDVASATVDALRDTASLAHLLLDVSGEARVRVAVAGEAVSAPRDLRPLVQRPAGALPAQDKRGLLFAAFDHLWAARFARDPAGAAIELPPAAPVGAVEVDAGKCTLCLACVQLCPTHALLGAEKALVDLGLVEQRCVQCGLCERGCPERAIRLRPRMLVDARARQEPRLIASDTRAACVECGAPFMSRRMLEASIAKVQHLPQFAGDGVRRLRMCQACRQRATLLDATGLR